jgi:hypothetical protein
MSILIVMSVTKLKVYVHSIELPTVNLFDKDDFASFHNAEAFDAISRPSSFRSAQKNFGDHLERALDLFQNRYLTDGERAFLSRVESFCHGNDIEFELVDVGTLSFLEKVKSGILFLRTPVVSCGKKMLRGIPSGEDLEELCKR